LLDLAPGPVCTAIKRQREGLRNPPKTVDDLLTTFENQGLTLSTAALRRFAELL
jgi:hypothetical protein